MRVAVIVTARPSWAKLSSLCAALTSRPDVELQIIACASALLERYGNVSAVVEAQGFTITDRVWSVYEGENLLTSAKETGALLGELSSVLSRLRSDCVVVCADRHEVLAAAQAGAYLHVPVAHLQGGERSGSIDDKVRDAITQLADYHFVTTKRAAMRVYALTGAHDRIWALGCPSIDVAKHAMTDPPVTAEELGGAGAPIDLAHSFLTVLQHPNTEEADDAGRQMQVTLEAACASNLQVLVLWPGQDAGQGPMAKQIRLRQETGRIHTVRNLPPRRFLRLLTQARCLIGNSSAGIREASYLGTPVVNVGTRQHGRERGPNVIDVPYDLSSIKAAIEYQAQRGRYPSSALYGRGDAGERIAEVLSGLAGHRASRAS